MQLRLDPGGINTVERNMQPPHKAMITIPVIVDGEDIGVAVYVAVSPFTGNMALAERVMRAVAQKIQLPLE